MKTGFSLLETLVYISCMTLAITLFFIMLHKFYANLKKSTGNVTRFLEVVTALEIMKRELKKVPLKSGDCWAIDIKENRLLFKLGGTVDNQICGFCVKSGNLYRYLGSYNFAQKKWFKKSVSLLAQNIKKISFELLSGQLLSSGLKIKIFFNLGTKEKKLEEVLFFSNGLAF